MDTNKAQRFLKLMSLMESSGGKNTNHKPIKEGIHSGDAAIGQYGLMPNTIKEMATRRNQQGVGDKLDNQIVNIDNPVIPSVLTAYPELESRYAEELAKKVIDRSSGDKTDAAYRWRWGHNLPSERVEQLKQENPEYFERMKKLMPGIGEKK